jgi:hypothetical protein
MAVTNNAVGGKDPWGGRADGAGKHEGMAGRTGPNDPGGLGPREKVRQLQRRLWAGAKRAPGRRFHALFDQIWRDDILREAWERVRRNRGAAGVDSQSIRDVEQSGVESFLEALGNELRTGEYRPSLVRRRYIPKADGRKRPLGIPTVRDRVAQMAAKLVLEPVFEADFLPVSYGFRPKRSATMALEVLRKLGAKGGHHVLDADIRDYFGSIDHEKLMKLVGRRVSDRRVLKLLRSAACNDVDQAGASPAAAIARFGCVAMPDDLDRRLSGAKAQVEVLGAERSVRPVRRASESWGRSGERTLQRRQASPPETGGGSMSKPSLFRRGEGQWIRRRERASAVGFLLRRMGGGTRGMAGDPKQGRSRGLRSPAHKHDERGDGWWRDWRIGS